jgi:hypothetical protein
MPSPDLEVSTYDARREGFDLTYWYRGDVEVPKAPLRERLRAWLRAS